MRPFRHACGLEHHNILVEHGFGALIAVTTPAVDDSGVSHAVEHLVFRRSKAFEHAESLFQLTALSDLSINASTYADVTYYHCYSQCQQTCLLGLNYLLNGLLAPVFVEEDLSQEIYRDEYYGVLNRELGPQQGKLQRAIDRSDTSAQRCYQYGGDIDLISHINLDDVTRYHGQYYQADKMTLITRNIAPKDVASLLESISYTPPNSEEYNPKSLAEDTEYETDKHVFRWWFDREFFDYLSIHHANLSELLNSHKAQLVPLQYKLNKQQQFVLDVICPLDCREELIYQTLIKYFLANPGEVPSYEQQNKHYKFSAEIMCLVNYFRTLDSKLNAQMPQQSGTNIALSLGLATHFRLRKIPKQKPTLSPLSTSMVAAENRLIPSLSQYSAKSYGYKSEYSHKPLPAVFKTLFSTASTQLAQHKKLNASVCCNEHCIILFTISDSQKELAIVTSFVISAYPSFLAARTQGHCYAVGCQYLDETQHLAFYSAFDVAPESRANSVPSILSSLQQDSAFIEASLPLAKAKLNSENTDDITSARVNEFLSHSLLAHKL